MKYSFILPTYNRSELLKETLNSLTNQDFDKGEYEIIIIDDNSNDNTESIVKEYLNRNKIIRYNRNKGNKGIGYNRNLGIELANGEFIIQTEDDAKYPVEYLSKIDNEIKKLSSEKWGTIIVNPRRTWNFNEGIVPKLVDFRRKSIDELTKKGKRDVIGGRIYAKKLAKEIGGYKPLKIGEDTEFVQRIKNKGYKIIAIFSTYRIHWEPNTFKKFYKRMFKQGYAYKEYKEEFNPKVSMFGKIFWMGLFLFPIMCLLSTILFGYLVLFFMIVGFISLSFLNQEIRGMYPLIMRSKKYRYLVFFVFLYYLTEIYGIFFGRFHRSIKEKQFLIY